MKYVIIILILSATTVNKICGQTSIPKQYMQLVQQADSLFKNKQFMASANRYSQAFNTMGGKALVNDRYNAACAWARAGNADSAFAFLNKVAVAGKYASPHIENDADLISLHKDARWNAVIARVKQNRAAENAGYNQEVKAILEDVFKSDQQYRKKADSVQNTFGLESSQMKGLLNSMRQADQANLTAVKKILDQYGWLGPDQVGLTGSLALYAVIVHADLETMEKYFPLMQSAVAQRKASKSNLAYLQDKIEIRKYHYQTYGTQVEKDAQTGKFKFGPIKDRATVDQRRAEAGLPPLKEYAKQWGINL